MTLWYVFVLIISTIRTVYLTLTRRREVADKYINEKLVVTLLPNFI